mmetsp:Transcript_25961/g.42868  ORF Transcript_25961/g.42868 Transcript_25961/m.42868 type:complete len:218 (+) Transcript_25961:75-728(+)
MLLTARAFRLFLPIFIILMQSPLSYSTKGSAISPLQVLVRYGKDELLKKDESGSERRFLLLLAKAVLFPGNSAAEILSPTIASPFSASTVWDHGLELAFARADDVKLSISQPEILVAASWCFFVGSLLTLLLRRVHVLLMFGIALLCATLFAEGLMPTIQFTLCVAAVMLEMIYRTAQQRQVSQTDLHAATAPTMAESGNDAPNGGATTSDRKCKGD